MVQQMTTALRTINPAFLQEIKDSNPDLWATLHQVRAIADAGRTDASDRQVLRQFVRLLSELRDLLALQFSLEESYGYLDSRIVSVTEQDSRVRLAIEQHRCLYLAITDLCDLAEDLQYRGMLPQHARSLLTQTSEFDQQLRHHEQLESEIIELAYFDQRR